MLSRLIRRLPMKKLSFRSRKFSNWSDKVRPERKNELHPAMSNIAADLGDFPRKKINTWLNICPQGQSMVIETLGKFSRVQNSGVFVSIPFIQEIYVVDTRETVVDVFRQNAYTSDNVSISIAAQLYVQATDPYKTCYNVKQPLTALVAQAQSALRSSVGNLDLDHLLRNRVTLNQSVSRELQNTEKHWGMAVRRVEITELTPDSNVAKAMDLQATAERERRQTEKNAEAKKRAMELEAEGYRAKVISEAEGDMRKRVLEAEGRAKAMEIEATAQLVAISQFVGDGVSKEQMLQWYLNKEYLHQLRELATSGKHSSYFIGQDISNVNGMLGKSLLPLINEKTEK